MESREKYRLGDATAELNPLTGDWMITGQVESTAMYACSSWKRASIMLQRIDHYNRTSEIKLFRGKPKSDFISDGTS